MEAGGYASKLGHRYEDLWMVRQLLALLGGEIVAVEREPAGSDEPGADLWVTGRDGVRECHQCKAGNRSEAEWGLSELAARGVLKALRWQLERGPSHRFFLISGTPAPKLDDLARAARDSRDPQTFFEHQVTGSRERKSAFEAFCRAVDLSTESDEDLALARDLLQRTGVHQFQDSGEERRNLRMQARRWVQGDPEEVLRALESWGREQLRRVIRFEHVAAFLKEQGFPLQDLARDDRLPGKVARLRHRFTESLTHLLAGDRLIPRPETQAVLEALADGEVRIVLVHGDAGIGKSGVLLELTRRLDEQNTPHLPLRLDRQQPRGSTRRFGEGLDLPASPAFCLSAVAGGRSCVLILDQLDALRWTSAHSSDAWDVCRELLEEALSASPPLKVVVCCRSFDLDHDPQLSGWAKDAGRARRIRVAELPEGTVREVVERAGGSYDSLRPRERSLLTKVLHLKLWADLAARAGEGPHFDSPRDLLRNYFQSRYDELAQRGIDRSEADRILGRVVDRMDVEGTVTLALRHLRASESQQQALQSVHLLQIDGDRVSFSHQSYLDFLLAERLMERMDRGDLTVRRWLGERSRQSLFRREQLRLILGYLRDERLREYLPTLRELLGSEGVRFHLKHLVLQFLGQVDPPNRQEVDLVLDLLREEAWRRHVLSASIFGSTPWFDALDRRGCIETWLNGEDEELHNAALWALRRVNETEGDRVAAILRPYAERGEAQARLCAGAFSHSTEEDSHHLFALRVHLTRRRALVDERPRWPRIAEGNLSRLRCLLVILLRQRGQELAEETVGELYGRREMVWLSLEEVKVAGAGDRQLLLAWHALLPALEQALSAANGRSAEAGTLLSAGLDEAKSGPLLDLLRKIAAELLERDWRGFLRLLRDGEGETDLRDLMAMEALGAGPQLPELADRALEWLMEQPQRLRLRRLRWDSPWAAAGDVIARLSPCCSQECFQRLERFLIELHEPDLLEDYRYRHEWIIERGWDLTYPSRAGATPYHLLPRLAPDRCSIKAKGTICELERKFGGEHPIYFTGVGKLEMGAILSPISRSGRLERFTDRTWLALIHNKKLGRRQRGRWKSGEGFVEEASPRTFASDLGNMTARQPERFARLALRISPAAHLAYLGAILDGVASGTPPNGLPEEGETWRPPSHEALEALLGLPTVQSRPEYALSYCRVLRQHARYPWSESVLHHLVSIARTHPDPEPSVPAGVKSNRENVGLDLSTRALNCTRGAAGYAVRGLLFAHPERIESLRPALEALVADPHPAVRVAGVAACLPVLNCECESDRAAAVAWFLTACDGDERILATREVTYFLRDARGTHLNRLRPLLERMLGSELGAVASAGAQQVAATYLIDGELEELFQRCLDGPAPLRAGVAKVSVELLREPEYHEDAKAVLLQLLDDPDPVVRREVANASRRTDLSLFSPNDPFLVAFAESKVFEEHPSQLLYTLKNHGGSLLPFAPCLLTAGRTLATRDGGKRGARPLLDTHTLIPLLLRLYEKSSKLGHEAVHQECLDLWDFFLERQESSALDLSRELDAS